MKAGSESIKAMTCRRRILLLLAGIMEGMENTRLPKCVMFGELVGGAGFVVGARKSVGGISPGRPYNIRYQHPPVGDCSPGQVGVAQDGETRAEKRDETFHGEIDR